MQSIITFKEDDKVDNEDKHNNVDGSTEINNLVKKRKLSISSDGVAEKKVKKEILKVNSTDVKKNIKDKHNSNIENGQNNFILKTSDNEKNEKNTLIEKLDSHIKKSESISNDKNETIIVPDNVDSNIKKKRKRNKGKKVKLDTTINVPGLRIMSK